jgi:hypothetical protein
MEAQQAVKAAALGLAPRLALAAAAHSTVNQLDTAPSLFEPPWQPIF